MSNQQKRYKTRSRKKPIFSDKKSGNSAVGIIIMIVLLAAMVFIGYSVGKPIVDYFSGRPANTTPDNPPPPVEGDTHLPVTTAPEQDEADPTSEPTASSEPRSSPSRPRQETSCMSPTPERAAQTMIRLLPKG